MVLTVRSILGKRVLRFREDEDWTIRDRILRPDGQPFVAGDVSTMEVKITFRERLILTTTNVSPGLHVPHPYTNPDVLGALRGAAGQDDAGTWTIDSIGANFLWIVERDTLPDSLITNGPKGSLGGLSFTVAVKSSAAANQFGDFNVYYPIQIDAGTS